MNIKTKEFSTIPMQFREIKQEDEGHDADGGIGHSKDIFQQFIFYTHY